MSEDSLQVAGSFRDPSGFVFSLDGHLYRQVNRCYQESYDAFMGGGLYKRLTENQLLIPHQEVATELAPSSGAYRVLQPVIVPFVSYPYEWSFTQLKTAALLTLDIQEEALKNSMSLKDASAYNIQFVDSQPIHIDTLSFEPYREGEPWVAYRQFCEHFLMPLSLMSSVDIRLQRLLRTYLDGIPLDLGSSLLPARTKLSFGLTTHVHLHAKAQQRFSSQAPPKQLTKRGRVSRRGLLALLESLKSVTRKLTWDPSGTEWCDYYDNAHYDLKEKQSLVEAILDRVQTPAKMVWDLGSNTGLFSRLAGRRGAYTVSWDLDPAAVEKNYLQCLRERETSILPLLLDLSNPSPGLGWAHEERASLVERGPADLVLALALIHHLAISNNLPFSQIAGFLSQITRSLIIEFVPKNDPKVQQLLTSREDIFTDYVPEAFEKAFSAHFSIQEKRRLAGTDRDIYLMQAI